MFQNITESVGKQEDNANNSKIKIVLKEIFKVKNIVIMFLTLLVSSLAIDEEIVPFGLAMIGASISTEIPVLGVFITAIIRNCYWKWI